MTIIRLVSDARVERRALAAALRREIRVATRSHRAVTTARIAPEVDEAAGILQGVPVTRHVMDAYRTWLRLREVDRESSCV